MREPKEPVERSETLRQGLLRHLEQSPCTARDLSELLGVKEREIPSHLEHLERTLRRSGKRLAVRPAECLGCGFVFRKRTRLTKPGACPSCRGQRIEPPLFSVEQV